MKKKQTDWLKILRYSSLLVLVTGILPTLASFQATQEPWRLFFDLLTWPLDNHQLHFQRANVRSAPCWEEFFVDGPG